MKTKEIQPFRFYVAEEKADQVMLEVATEDYELDIAAGIPKNELLKPGKHEFRRFSSERTINRDDLQTSNSKVQISLKIDLDILNYFKERANEPNAPSYQTQINNELRAIVKRREQNEEVENRLLKNKKFISALAEELKKTA